MNKKILLIVIIITIVLSCTRRGANNKEEENKSIPIVDFSVVEPLLSIKNDTIYVINFWATWCAPCVKEIPYFEAINQEYSQDKIKVILINLDFSNHYHTRLIPFVKDKSIRSKVIMLDDPDANKWINTVDPSWSGAIPATLIYKGERREFFEKELTYDELKNNVVSFLN